MNNLIICYRECQDGSIGALKIIRFHLRKHISPSSDLYAFIYSKANYTYISIQVMFPSKPLNFCLLFFVQLVIYSVVSRHFD